MKNRVQPVDYEIPVDILRDGQIEDDMELHPLMKEAGIIKQQVLVALTQREYDEYMSYKGIRRINFIRNKALSLIQK